MNDLYLEYNFVSGIFSMISQRQMAFAQQLKQEPKSIPVQLELQKLQQDIDKLKPILQKLQNKIIDHLSEAYEVELNTFARSENKD